MNADIAKKLAEIRTALTEAEGGYLTRKKIEAYGELIRVSVFELLDEDPDFPGEDAGKVAAAAEKAAIKAMEALK